MIDKNGRIFGKLNVVDALVIVLVLGLVFAAVYRFTASGMVREADQRVRFTLMIEGVRDLQVPYYITGLMAFDARNGQYIGRIAGIQYETLTTTMPLPDGTVIMAEMPGVLRLFVDIEADARVTPTAILVHGAYELNVGRRLHLNTKFIDVEGIIVGVDIL